MFSDVRPHVFTPFAWPKQIEIAPADGAAEPVEPEVERPDFEAIAESARAEGFAQGYAEGARRAEAEHRELLDRLAALVESAHQDAERLARGLEEQVVELSLLVAERVIEREATVDPAVVLRVVHSALAECQVTNAVHVRVNPLDYDLVQPRWQELLPRRLAERSELIADLDVERGGCVIETSTGRVDAQLRSKLQQVSTSFRAVLDGEPV